ncbi:FtsX-like permease family protein [Streptomyces sp. NPDC006314]|uniref:FtsX-like permease family protein n=1 Tax=Streptomyces sp. NPDC006314 TaxID=3154475 RepID=UPI0033B9CE78
MLGIAVAVLIVANVVGGAVVSGFRHIGILKALGFAPGQVLGVYLVMISVPAALGCALGTLTVTSMAVPGALGSLLGIPLGIAAYEVAVPRMAAGVDISLPSYMTDVWHVPRLGLLALAGIVTTVIGALAPARRAARLTVAEVLHSE